MGLGDLLRKVKTTIDGAVDEATKDFQNAFNNFSGGDSASPKSNYLYRYPNQSSLENAPFVIFSHHTPNYVTAGGEDNVRTILNGHIAMYIPMNISIADSFSYDSIESGIVGSLYDNVNGFNNADDARSGILSDSNVSALTAKYGPQVAGAALATAAGAPLAAVGLSTGDAATSYFKEFQKREGAVINPRQFMLFRAPNLRSFNMEFRFIPENPKEAKIVDQIIKQFREASYPSLSTGGLAFSFPDSWKIEFVNVEGMINIPEVAITGINIAYNPNAMSYFKAGDKSNHPVEVVLSLQFSELLPITRQNVQRGQ